MYKNKLQELAQRSCFNLPSYACIREGPDHAPRFKASVNFNGETYESPSYCSTLRQAEHSAAEVALNELASHGPTSSLAARILDETGVYKNLLQEISQRVGGCMPSYSTFRSGQGHISTFICTVELVGVIFTGDPAKSKKQAEKNAAMVAWLSLKSLAHQLEASFEKTHKDEQEHLMVARALQNYLTKARLARIPLPIKFPTIIPRPSIEHHSSPTTSKILPLIYPKTATRGRFTSPSTSNHIPSFQKTVNTTQAQLAISTPPNEIRPSPDNFKHQATQKFPTASAPPYIPIGLCNPHGRVSPVVTVRNMVPVFSSTVPVMRPPTIGIALPVNIRQAVPVYAAPVCKELPITSKAEELPFARVSPVCKELPITSKAEELPFARVSPGPLGLPSSEVFTVQTEPIVQVCGPPVSSGAATNKTRIAVQESKVIGDLKDLKI